MCMCVSVCVCVRERERERERERALAYKDTTLNLPRGVHGQSVRIPGLVAIENYQIQIQI